MSDQVSEFHEAQHSRRERLRITNSEELVIIHQPYQYGNISYDPSVVLSSSEMINFSSTTTSSTGGLQHSSCGWNNVTNFNSSGSGGIETSNNLSPMFVGVGVGGVEGGVLSASLNLNSSTIDVKPYFYGGYNEMQQSVSVSDAITSNAEFSSSVLYHDTLQEVVKSATVGNQGVDTRRVGSWMENESGLMVSNYMDQSHHLYDKNCGLGSNFRTNVSDNSSVQGLALSLSPVPRTNTLQMEKRNNVIVPENFAIAHRSAVPLGPFTGYATILKSSKFLRPAQQLLDELCELAAGSSNVVKCSNFSKKVRDGFRVSCDVNAAAESSSGGGGGGGDSSGLNESNVCPEYLQKKAKLIFMQEEICKKYKQYHQQMQMVVSSFETVAGLSAATPYISFALKTVSQHFKSLRNAITDHLKNIRQALGEDLPSPASVMSNKGDGNSSRLKFVDQTSLHKQKSGGGAGVAFLESQQHVWRPQRGLPERAVAILRAWLFDHFLHPYPTDSDKHMLASQTGLTRNQVSNWFINARVRVWKPMVEEIHTLETKGGDQTRKSDVNMLMTERTSHVSRGQHFSNVLLNMSGVVMPEKQEDCQGLIGPSERLDESSSDHHMWRNQEKRSRIECHNISDASSMDGSLMGFVPYQRNALDIGGNIGAVSLTLGLRHNAEAAQQQQQQLQLHEHRLRQQFGGHMIHDFVD
ncbi:hypothetical protein KY285_008463 [Solanum tuberosum]|nr:hypothetical protein KY284_008453 [Solanum tuberosum]KAH0746806.1 hypothetical protein KY285_008463 [Solanum tuberosum]